MDRIKWENGWRASFILILWAILFSTWGNYLLSDFCLIPGGIFFLFMFVVRFDPDVIDFFSAIGDFIDQ